MSYKSVLMCYMMCMRVFYQSGLATTHITHCTKKLTCFFCFVQADVDNSGTIDYIEFIAATLHLNKLEREEHLVAAFSYFDKDGSGYITVDELQQACKEHNMPDAFLDDVINEADQDNVSLTLTRSDA